MFAEKDHLGVLLQLLRVEQRLIASRMKREPAVGQHVTRGLLGHLEEIVRPFDAVVFAERTLVEGNAGLECTGRPHAEHRPVLGRQHVLDGEVEILHDLVHHKDPAVLRLVKLLRVGIRERTVVPGHVAKHLDLLIIEIGTHQTAEADVMIDLLLGAFRSRGIGQEVIDVPNGGPVPYSGADVVRGQTAVDHLRKVAARTSVDGDIVANPVVEADVQIGIKAVGIGLQVFDGLEEVLLRHAVAREPVHECIVAAGGGEQARKAQIV